MTLASDGLFNAKAYRFTYADATARGAASGFAPGDVGALALQLDNASLWILTDDSPATWAAVGGVAVDAEDVAYDNGTSGLAATDVQAALDEIAAGAGGGGGVVLQLDYRAVADLHNGTAVSAATWTDIIGNENFDVDDAGSIVEIAIGGMVMLKSTAGGSANVGVRFVVDSAGTPVTKVIGGSIIQTISTYDNVFGGVQPVKLTGLSAGTHTIKPQVYCHLAADLVCRPTTVPDRESLYMQVTEFLP